MLTDYTPFQQTLVKGLFDGEGEEIYLKACSLLPSEKPIVVEIGSCTGWTACLMGLQVKKRGGLYFSLDNWSEGHIYGNPAEIASRFHTNMIKADLADTVIQIFADSTQCGWNQLFYPDLLFVDGNHSTEGVIKDCNAWFPRIRKGKYVMFHDWEFPTVSKAVKQMTKGGWEKIDENYKVILFKKL